MSTNTSAVPSFHGSGGIETTATTGDFSHIHRRISWGAIFGGAILALAIQLVLSLLGAGIGLSTIGTNAGSTPSASSLGIGAGIWWIISSCLALGAGGYVAAWLAGVEIRFDGILHGLVTWGIATLVTFWLLTSAVGGIIGGGFSALGSLTSMAGSGLSDAARPIARAAGVSPDTVRQQAEAYLQPATSLDPATMSSQDAQKAVATDLVTYAGGGGGAAAAKERIINIMAAQTKVSHDEAARRFEDGQAKLQQLGNNAVQTAKNTADASASAASRTSFAGFGVLLLGAIAAAIGGSVAVQRRLGLAFRRIQR